MIKNGQLYKCKERVNADCPIGCIIEICDYHNDFDFKVRLIDSGHMMSAAKNGLFDYFYRVELKQRRKDIAKYILDNKEGNA